MGRPPLRVLCRVFLGYKALWYVFRVDLERALRVLECSSKDRAASAQLRSGLKHGGDLLGLK
jgi:hypothetical protein